MMQAPHDDLSTRKLPALEELQARPQWVCWRKEKRQGKPTKVPYSAMTGKRAETDNPATWASYAQAVQAQRARRYDGIGYVFHQDYTGIDLDHCVDADGSLAPWARVLLSRLGSYAEYSPSQTGIHILVRGTIPSGIRRRVPGASHPEAAIEMYCERRYFTVTGCRVEGTPDTIEISAELQTIHLELTAPRQPREREQPQEPHSAGEMPDEALIGKAMRAKNGATFRALWQGDTSGYPSQSEAELALCQLLAFWTGRDPHRMDRLFRRSALYRPEKWDRPARTGELYGEGTLALAIARCTETYRVTPASKILLFRRKPEEAAETFDSPLPDTGLDFVLACLKDEEEGDARLYAHLFKGRCIYDHTEGMWYEWREHHWVRDECKHALLLASGRLASVYLSASTELTAEAAQAEQHLDPDLLRQRQMRDDPHLKRYEWLKETTGALIGRAKALKKLGRAQAILTYAQAYLGITSREWDTHSWFLACTNGVLDLQTGELQPGKPEDYLRTAIPTAWAGLEALSPRFEHFLQELFQDKAASERADLIAFMQRLLGYSITGQLSHHIFTILYGAEGRNGKDTLLDTLKEVLGPLVGAVSNDLFVAQEKFRASGAPTPHLCDLQGKRLVWGSETRQGDKLNIAQIKLLTGGGEISARQLHGRQFSFAPTHKLLLMTNYKPHADARDQAFWSRACLIEFGIRFVDHPHTQRERQADPKLKEKLRGERSGILAWLVRGCLAWQQQGLTIPLFIRLSTEQYRDEEDNILHFIRECCLVQAAASVKASALYDVYKVWCKDNQFGSGMNATLFGNEMSRRFEKKRVTVGMIYQGIGLITSKESNGGSMYTPQDSDDGDKDAPEANLQASETTDNVGYVGFHQVFPQSKKTGLYEGQNREKPYIPYISSTTTNNCEIALEADVEQNNNDSQPYRDPTCNRQSVETDEQGRQEGDNQDSLPLAVPTYTLGRRLTEPDEIVSSPRDVLLHTPDGLGYLTGVRWEQDVTFVAPQRQPYHRYKFGVRLLQDGLEHFYLAGTLWEVQREDQPTHARNDEVSS